MAEETVQTAETEDSFTAPVSGEAVAAFSDSELTYNAALEDWRTHNGVDLAAEVGEEVYAALDGEVLSIESDPLLGTVITLNHGDGLMTLYGNLSEEVAVRQGDKVSAGQVIGTVGETAAGESNEGGWVHFAVKKDGVLVDPMEYLG
ncbi:MAG: M23 family metallopeptidase [Clostridiales bacterium]|nr:M23 family metallopeptidase [Clostridiales bacterium]